MIEMVRSELAPVRDDATNADIDAYHEISMDLACTMAGQLKVLLVRRSRLMRRISPHVNIASRLEAATAV